MRCLPHDIEHAEFSFMVKKKKRNWHCRSDLYITIILSLEPECPILLYLIKVKFIFGVHLFSDQGLIEESNQREQV